MFFQNTFSIKCFLWLWIYHSDNITINKKCYFSQVSLHSALVHQWPTVSNSQKRTATNTLLDSEDVSSMCMACSSDPSPSCMGACSKSSTQSLMDLIVRPYCHSCALAPSALCWEKCNRAARFATEFETPAVYCMQCASDPSPTCMGACAKEGWTFCDSWKTRFYDNFKNIRFLADSLYLLTWHVSLEILILLEL